MWVYVLIGVGILAVSFFVFLALILLLFKKKPNAFRRVFRKKPDREKPDRGRPVDVVGRSDVAAGQPVTFAGQSDNFAGQQFANRPKVYRPSAPPAPPTFDGGTVNRVPSAPPVPPTFDGGIANRVPSAPPVPPMPPTSNTNTGAGNRAASPSAELITREEITDYIKSLGDRHLSVTSDHSNVLSLKWKTKIYAMLYAADKGVLLMVRVAENYARALCLKIDRTKLKGSNWYSVLTDYMSDKRKIYEILAEACKFVKSVSR